MAIYTNFNQINEYMKIGSSKDSCWICAKKMGVQGSRDAYDTLRSLEGKVENKKVIVIRRSGIDTCICMDCVKTIHDEHIAPTIIAKDNNEQAEAIKEGQETKEAEAKEENVTASEETINTENKKGKGRK